MRFRPDARLTALAAAALFGATTPLAKLLLGNMSAFMVAGLFYLGSGAGLGAAIVMRHLRHVRHAKNDKPDAGGERHVSSFPGKNGWPWLIGAIAAGGIAGPALLMLGLSHTSAATASLLLNLEGVLTAVIAWVVFRENVDLPVLLGMLAIVAASVLLSYDGLASLSSGAWLIALACLCWAIDNNLTRNVATHDAVTIACLKGLVAGAVNLTLALLNGAAFPGVRLTLAAMATGLAGYGASLVLFVVALRHLGTARTSAYFSVAPLIGVVLSLLVWPDMPPATFWLALALMALGVWLHARERHVHEHTHEYLEHAHRHRHDEHHQHAHDFPYTGDASHTHAHVHLPVTHTHAHYPDVGHRHRH